MIPADHIERARAVPIEHEIARRGIALKRAGAELIGPCPCCGGTDRFGAHTRKQVFNCRGCGAKGDVIALVQHLDRCDFKDAIATLAGETTRKIKRTPPAKPAKRDTTEVNEHRRRDGFGRGVSRLRTERRRGSTCASADSQGRSRLRLGICRRVISIQPQ
jgi:phage/plasmid primase-like uncharacterized protein